MKNFHTKTALLSITFLVTLFFTSLTAQNTINDIPVLDSLEIAKQVRYFNIKDNKIEGDGADILKQAVASSKFFVLGEYHYSTEISKLTESLAPLLDKAGYKGAAFEVGPLSGEKLKELSRVPDATEAKLKAFNAKYLIPSFKYTAIPMFSFVPDAQFLRAFSETKMEIFGIDQEFVFSVIFLGDDLVASKLNDSKYEEIKAVWEKARKTIQAEYDNYNRETLNNIFTHADFLKFQKMFDADDLYAQDVFKKLLETWKIYSPSKNVWGHQVRLDYIRSNFLKKYKAIEKVHHDARYFIKIGSLHAAKTNFSLKLYDIGAVTQEIAELEQVKSTNVVIAKGTYDDKDFTYEDAPSLVQFHKKDRWTIVDLKKLREDLLSKKFQILTHPAYQDLNIMIHGYDLLLIPPADQKPIENW